MRRQVTTVRRDDSLGDNGYDIPVVGDLGAEIGCHRLRLAGFSSSNGGRETASYQAEGQEQRQQSADQEASARNPWEMLDMHLYLEILPI